MYYPDLSINKKKLDLREPRNVFNVGWLDTAHRFETGEVSEAFLERLFLFCSSPGIARYTMGRHYCPFCPAPVPRHSLLHQTVVRNAIEIVVGSAEIYIVDKQENIFIVPDMIYHYIDTHRYLPPQEFINAVLGSYPARTQIFFRKYVVGYDIW